MNQTALVASENKDFPILIVDKKGELGRALADKLKNESLIVFVSSVYENPDENIIHIPFLKKIPSIPDNTYSHIFLIDEASDITDKVISPFLKKAEKDNSIFLLCVGKRFLNEKIVTNLLSSYDKAKVAILGDIFAKNTTYDAKSEINDFIHQIKKFNKITIPGDGTREIFPILIDDVVDSILEAIFGDNDKEKVFLIFSNQGTSLLKVASVFKKINPNIMIDYVNEKSKKSSSSVVIEGKHLVSENSNLEEKLKKVNFDQSLFTNNPKYKNNEDNSSAKKYVLFLLSFLLSILIAPVIISFIAALIGGAMLFSIKQEVGSENIMLIKSQAVISSKSFHLANSSIKLVEKEASLIGAENVVFKFSNKISQGQSASDLVLSAVNSFEKANNIIKGESSNSQLDFSYIYTESKKSYYAYQKLLQEGIVPSFLSNKIVDAVRIYSSTIDFWPDLFGFNGQKTYMVLFQNNMELRPGGGFIGSYATFNINKGRLENFKIYDVYDADGQLKTHFEPPFAIRRYLPSAHWYLRDSNFNVDFSKGAVASAVFLDSEMHQKVDGIISVDLSFIKSLLLTIGTVNVSDYNEKVSSENFFQIAEKHAEKDFFPGSTQKKDFLKSFYSALIIKLNENKELQYLPLISTLASSIYEKHVLFSFSNQNMQTALSLNGYSSALVDNREKDTNIINDFIGINEANLGVDKVNYFVTRSFSHTVSIANDGSIKEKALIVFKNSADEKVWTGGGYKDYLRIILPLGTNLDSITIDNNQQKIISAITDPSVYEKKGFVPPPGLEVEKYNQDKNTIYGFLMNIGPKQLKTISIEYSLPQKINTQNAEIKYDLKLFKQPGIDVLPYEFFLSFPKNLRVIDSSKEIKAEKTTARFSGQVARDRELTITFGQQ